MNHNKTSEDIITELVAGYKSAAEKGAPHLDYLPDKGEITHIIHLLRRLIFPGYFEENDVGAPFTEYKIRAIITEAEFKLQRQICRSLNLEAGNNHECSCMFSRATEICSAFLKKLPELREILLLDVKAAYDGDPAAGSEHEIIFAYPGIFAISVYRLAHELSLLSVPFIPRIMTEYAHGLTGIDIHPGATIGRHFFIDHGTGVVIGETTIIGDHVKIYQGVTLGAISTRGGQNLRGKKRHPTLEDEVTVYSGASILGGMTIIGKGCVVGGNVFITQSVPPYTRVNLKRDEPDYAIIKTDQPQNK